MKAGILPAGRVKCLVPFCRCTRGARWAGDPGGEEWICHRHWVATSKVWRRRYFLFVRRGRWELVARMWVRLKRQALERAAGL